MANPNAEEIDEPPLQSQIESLLAENSGGQESSYDDGLKTLVTVASRVVEATNRTSPERGALFFHRIAEIDLLTEALDLQRYREPVSDYLKTLAFAATYNLQWHVLG